MHFLLRSADRSGSVSIPAGRRGLLPLELRWLRPKLGNEGCEGCISGHNNAGHKPSLVSLPSFMRAVVAARRRKGYMISKPLNFPPVVAEAFARDMAAYFAEDDPLRRDEIALHQLLVLKQLRDPREKPLLLSDIKRMFVLMRNKELTAAPTIRSIHCFPRCAFVV